MNASAAHLRFLLSRRTGHAPWEIHPWQHLEHDLGLTPLGRVLVALEAEEATRICVPLEEIAGARTAGQLMALLGRDSENASVKSSS